MMPPDTIATTVCPRCKTRLRLTLKGNPPMSDPKSNEARTEELRAAFRIAREHIKTATRIAGTPFQRALLEAAEFFEAIRDESIRRIEHTAYRRVISRIRSKVETVDERLSAKDVLRMLSVQLELELLPSDSDAPKPKPNGAHS